jgi:hypothetical protein
MDNGLKPFCFILWVKKAMKWSIFRLAFLCYKRRGGF